MKNKLISKLLTFPAALFLFALSAPAQTDAESLPLTADGKYSIVNSLKLQKKTDGATGTLEILRDARINGDFLVTQVMGEPPELGDNADEKTKEMIAKEPLRLVVLRLVGEGGTVIDSLELACAQADFQRVFLYSPTRASYEVSCAYETFAPLNGWEIALYDLKNERIKRLEAYDPKLKQPIEMSFVTAHRSEYKYVSAGGRGAKDILFVRTGWGTILNETDGDFYVSYERYHYDGKRWLRYERIAREDYWESEEDFPKLSKFPKAIKK